MNSKCFYQATGVKLMTEADFIDAVEVLGLSLGQVCGKPFLFSTKKQTWCIAYLVHNPVTGSIFREVMVDTAAATQEGAIAHYFNSYWSDAAVKAA